MTKGREVVGDWYRTLPDWSEPTTPAQRDDLATRIDAAIAEAEKAGVLHGQGHVRIVVDGAIAEEREALAAGFAAECKRLDKAPPGVDYKPHGSCLIDGVCYIAAAIRARGGKP